jgi:uncharacterized Zn finger protein (UPF0148 family)
MPCQKPGCAGKVKETIGRLRTSPTVRCPTCKTEFKVNAADLDRDLRSVQKRIDDLGRQLTKTFKT